MVVQFNIYGNEILVVRFKDNSPKVVFIRSIFAVLFRRDNNLMPMQRRYWSKSRPVCMSVTIVIAILHNRLLTASMTFCAHEQGPQQANISLHVEIGYTGLTCRLLASSETVSDEIGM